jgi:pilus assembly protein TadC
MFLLSFQLTHTMQAYIRKILNLIIDNIPIIIGVCILSIFYTYEISFGTVLLYMFAFFGFVFTFGMLVTAAVGFISKDTMEENQRLKDKVQKLQISLQEAIMENERLANIAPSTGDQI